jgi:hypothetical protein
MALAFKVVEFGAKGKKTVARPKRLPCAAADCGDGAE